MKFMAIAFARVSIHTRSKGHSAVAASAYRTATRLLDERTGTNYDFHNRSEVAFSEIILPHGANSKFHNRGFLWNEVERVENRINSQLCKDVVLALPKELDLVQQIELSRRFANKHFVENGLACDVAIHDGGDGNPHAHILVTMRRIEGSNFASHKARDLNPKFAKGVVVEGDYWNAQWHEFQNDYFQEHQLDLTVDLNHLISEKHEGRNRDESNHYVHEENKLIQAAREEIALHDVDNLINQISLTHSVFTRRDIEKLLFKTIRSEENSSFYLSQVEKTLSHQDVICLGANDRGIDCYTTRHQYIAEGKLLDNVEQLQKRSNHVFNQEPTQFIQQYDLNSEQKEAFSYITQGKDISVLIGRPGVGKSYLLKPIKDYYVANNCRVIGTSLSAKVAKALQAETGIQSYTIASLTYQLSNQKMELSSNDILVIDEAGMVDFANIAYLLEEVTKAGAKVILVGDPDQLRPIHKGEIFRGIAQHAGYIELDQIRRQRHEGDRMASLALAKGGVGSAIAHYEQRNALHFADNPKEAITSLVNDWQKSITTINDSKENIMLAFTRASVLALNEQTREVLREKNILSHEEVTWQRVTDRFNKPIDPNEPIQEMQIALGERILLRKNDKLLGVRNGDMAIVESLNTHNLTARLDSGELVILPVTYKYIDYGYALTVHKAQGMTVDNASVLIDSHYWDRNLSFVAMTRHRENLNIYADKEQHPNINALSKTLSRSVTKDNVIDWPLDLAIRHGFESDSLAGRVINHLAGLGQKIKEKYNYIVNYEAYIRQKMAKSSIESKTQFSVVARKVANYLDEQSQYLSLRRKVTKQAEELNVEASSLKGFKGLYNQSVVRDKKAYAIWTKHSEQLADVQFLSLHQKDIRKASERHERYLVIAELAEHEISTPLSEKLSQRSGIIDLDQDKIHIKQLASQFNKKSSELLQQIEGAQRSCRQLVFNQLKKNHQLLFDYDQLFTEHSKVSGFKAEQLDKLLLIKSREIIKNKALYAQLQNDLPNFAHSLMSRIKNHDLGLGKEIHR